jgi:hypothetical protein
MSYTVCNSVTPRVTHDVTNAERTTVQNQNQNQSVLTALSSSHLVTQDQIVAVVEGALCSCGAEAHPTVSATFLGLEPMA